MNCYIFIRNVLDFYLNHIFGNNIFLFIKSFLVMDLFIISLLLIVADYYDLKFGIIPNKISLILFIYGVLFNIFLAGLFNNPTFLLFSMALTLLVAIVSFILWHIGFWGGGDFKIFIGLTLSLSFLDFNHLNIFNFIGINIFNDLNVTILENCIHDLNLPISSQFIFYPKIFSILLNGILMAFISLLIFLIYGIFKNKKIKYCAELSLMDFKSMFNQISTKIININDLSEGMVLDKYYFNNENVFLLINEDKYSNGNDSNLNAYEEEDLFYLSSLNRIGLTRYDIDLINDLYKRDLIKNPVFKVKKVIPFMPFLTLGYFSFLIFGDFISIISGFIRFLF